jgi:hypothetical protein
MRIFVDKAVVVILRLLRLIKVMKMVNSFPLLQIILDALYKSGLGTAIIAGY